jgi:hypothetical protein
MRPASSSAGKVRARKPIKSPPYKPLPGTLYLTEAEWPAALAHLVRALSPFQAPESKTPSMRAAARAAISRRSAPAASSMCSRLAADHLKALQARASAWWWQAGAKAQPNAGDLVTHIDHGVGRYLGLKRSRRWARRMIASNPICRRRQAVPAGREHRASCRATARMRAARARPARRRRLAERKARMKNRVREIAGELIRIAAERIARGAAASTRPDRAL